LDGVTPLFNELSGRRQRQEYDDKYGLSNKWFVAKLAVLALPRGKMNYFVSQDNLPPQLKSFNPEPTATASV
jgi:hypothetical protein